MNQVRSWQILDPVFITLYRLTGYPLVDYYLGTFLLAFLTVLVGEFTISIVFKVNKAHLDRLNARVEKMKRLSEEALRLGDEKSLQSHQQGGKRRLRPPVFQQVRPFRSLPLAHLLCPGLDAGALFGD